MKTNPGRFFEDYTHGENILHAVPRTVSGGERARALLTETDMPISEVAYGCGFNATNTFTKAFRQRYGVQASGAAYLLRPDQHVCARWLTLDAVRLQAALNAALPQ